MSNVDEGLIHAWLEDQLPPDEAARVEQLVAQDPAWGAAAAEARGLIAASSRVLGALDSAPVSIGGAMRSTERVAPPRKSWASRNWLRSAAAIALVAGVSTVLFPRGDDVTILDSAQDDRQREAPSVTKAESPQIPATPPAPPVLERNDASARQSAARQSAGSAPAPVMAPVSASAVAPPPLTETPPTTTPPGRGGGVGAGIGVTVRDAASGSARAADVSEQRAEFAKAVSQVVALDSLYQGCWMRVDGVAGVAGVARQANERTAAFSMAALVLRFVPPTLTDVAVVTAPPVSPLTAAANARGGRGARPGMPIQHTTPRTQGDSTLVAEWVNANGQRTQLAFNVRGDTLRGTTKTVTNDVTVPGAALTAVRGPCPQ